MRLPDFIIGGAPRSATTWLYQVADSHPQIAMARPVTPEPKFFLIDELYEKGLDYYSQTWFEQLPEGALIGEKSTNYLESSTAVERISRDLPLVKMIFLLRNPIDRAYSNYLWSVQNGLESESFDNALDREDERTLALDPKLRYALPYSYISRGRYSVLLTPWIESLGKERICIMTTEELAATPALAMCKVTDFLNVERFHSGLEQIGKVNASNRPTQAVLSSKLRARLAEIFKEEKQQLQKLAAIDLSLW